MAEPLLLAYNLSGETASRLETLCRSQGIRYRAVKALEYAAPIGLLAGIPVRGGTTVSPVAGFPEPMLVMCHMLGPQLDDFLQGMRQSGMPGIPLKAVLTPYNVTWSSRHLRDELVSEHAAVQARTRED